MWSQLKVLKHKDILSDIVTKNIPTPKHIQFELTESCNYACTFCPWHGDAAGNFKNIDFTGKRFFPTQRLLELIDELEACGTKAISITGAGENLIHPNFDQIIKKLAASSMEFALTSNFGVKLSDDVLKDLLQAKWVRWSVNAADEATYNATNRPKVSDAYFISQNNLRRLTALRTDETIHIGASYVIGDYNKHDISKVATYVKSLGLDSLSFRPDTPMLRHQKSYEYSPETIEALENSQELSDKNFKVFINYARLSDSQKITDNSLRCYYSNHSVHIISNGDIYPCCMTRYDQSYKFGNIINQDFQSFWNTKERQEHYKDIYMKSCPSCHHTDTNKALQHFYESSDTLDNFI